MNIYDHVFCCFCFIDFLLKISAGRKNELHDFNKRLYKQLCSNSKRSKLQQIAAF